MGPTRRLQLSAYRYEKGSSMYNFTFHIPTTIHFGKGQISHLAELAQYGKKALLCYGGGSIKRNGIYDEALRILGQVGVKVEELSGVEPNPASRPFAAASRRARPRASTWFSPLAAAPQSTAPRWSQPVPAMTAILGTW